MPENLNPCPICQTAFDPEKVPGGICPRCLMMGGADDEMHAAAQPASEWVPPTVPELQAMLPAYEILEMIGRGGMGAVFKARQPTLDRIVAIKVLPVLRDEMGVGFVDRFKNEARLMARMNHPPAPLIALGLTVREAEVLLWIAQGKSNGEIGLIISAAENTVKKHVQHIFEKLGLDSRNAATVLALEKLSCGGEGRRA